MASATQSTESLSPGILSLIPTLYVGWADSILSPSEIVFVQSKIKELDFLTPDDKSYLLQYTDPKHPPSDQVFRQWKRAIQEYSQTLDAENIASLESLGLEIAKQSIGYQNEELWKSPKTKQAIKEIRKSLGVQNRDGARILPGHLVQEKSHIDWKREFVASQARVSVRENISKLSKSLPILTSFESVLHKVSRLHGALSSTIVKSPAIFRSER